MNHAILSFIINFILIETILIIYNKSDGKLFGDKFSGFVFGNTVNILLLSFIHIPLWRILIDLDRSLFWLYVYIPACLALFGLKYLIWKLFVEEK